MTKYRFAFSVALSLQFLMLRAIDHCHAFTSPKLATETPSRYQKQICSTTKPIDEQSILERDLPSNAAAEAAIKELEKLLERQRADIDITEDLLCRLKANCEGDEDVDSYVKSITAGFDYGFVSRSEGATMSETRPGYGPPKNFWSLGWEQFFRNLDAIKGEYKDEEQIELSEKQEELQDALEKLTLNSTAIWEREFADGPIDAPWIIKAPYLILCYFLDVVFEGKYTPSRFFLLETVARMPYFSYISMLHLYETLGFWRRSADMKRIHFAEELNEFRHLLIMESLGGDQRWWVRFLAQHSAIVYYWVLCVLWALSPSLSYKFSELLESHAVNTYGQFLDENEEKLRQMPPPLAATEYYTFGLTDPFYSEIQTSSGKAEFRRPGANMTSLYDAFAAIQADEGDHVSTMEACLNPDVPVRSPSIERRILTGLALISLSSLVASSGEMVPTDTVTDETVVAAVASQFGEGTGIGENLLEQVGAEESLALLSYLQKFVADAAGAILRAIAAIL